LERKAKRYERAKPAKLIQQQQYWQAY